MARIEPLSIEDVARTSDDVAVRRRFDHRNLVYLTVLLIFFGVVTIFKFVEACRAESSMAIAVSVANFVLVALLLLAQRDVYRERRGIVRKGMRGPAQLIRRHASATLLLYIAIQYVTVLYLENESGWMGWVSTLPLMVVGVRMAVAELVLLHGMLYAAVPIMLFVSDDRPKRIIPPLIAFAIMNLVVLAFEMWSSRRLRREVIGDWTERRTQAREQLRMRDELQYARELQIAMLPEAAPQLDWVDVAGVSLPATEVGGDYFDYFVEGNRLAMVCGDVAGHGLASGLVLVSLRSGFTLLRESLHKPGEVLQRLHDLVAQTSRRRMLATVAVVLLDRDAKQATIASAGHPPIIVRRDGSIRAVELFAPPLGVRLPVTIPQLTFDLLPGDLFVLHSDGVYEARNPADESYGLERLSQLVLAHPADASAESLRDAIARDVEQFRGGAPQDDDVTIVVGRML
jgi:hypothetical protein